MSQEKYVECLAKLRKVVYGDEVLSSDINEVNNCIKYSKNWLLDICNKYGIDPKYVYELDNYIAKLRYVTSGDIILPEDHNTIVDVLKKLRGILEKIEELVYKEGFEAGFEEGKKEAYPVIIEQYVSTVIPMGSVKTLASLQMYETYIKPFSEVKTFIELMPYNTVKILIL